MPIQPVSLMSPRALWPESKQRSPVYVLDLVDHVWPMDKTEWREVAPAVLSRMMQVFAFAKRRTSGLTQTAYMAMIADPESLAHGVDVVSLPRTKLAAGMFTLAPMVGGGVHTVALVQQAWAISEIGALAMRHLSDPEDKEQFSELASNFSPIVSTSPYVAKRLSMREHESGLFVAPGVEADAKGAVADVDEVIEALAGLERGSLDAKEGAEAVLRDMYSVREDVRQNPRGNIQSILVPRSKADSARGARTVAKRYGATTTVKVDRTDNYYRFRQFSPSRCMEGSYRTAVLPSGVKLVYCRKRGSSR